MGIVDLLTLGTPIVEAAALRDQLMLPAVLDASAVIEDVLYRTGDGHRMSGLSLALMLGVLRPVAKTDTLDEIEGRLPDIARDEGRDLARMRDMIATDYAPLLRLVDVTGVTIDHAGLRAVEKEAPRDAPSAILNLLLDPALLLTSDRDLLRNGFGRWYEEGVLARWPFAAVTARDAAAPLSVTLPIAVIMRLVGAVTADMVREHPTATTVAVVTAVLGAMAAVASPRWEQEWKPALSAMIGGAVTTFGRAMAPYPTAANQLTEFRAARPGSATPIARVARTLALGPPRGLLLSEVKAIHPTDAELVRPVLEAHSMFTRSDRWHWALGSPAPLDRHG